MSKCLIDKYVPTHYHSDHSGEEDYEDYDNIYNRRFIKFYKVKKIDDTPYDSENNLNDTKSSLSQSEKISQNTSLKLKNLNSQKNTEENKIKLSSYFKKNKKNKFNLSVKKIKDFGNEIHSGDKIKNIHYTTNILIQLENHPFRQIIFSPIISGKTFNKHQLKTYKGLIYAANCLKGPSENFLNSKKINLGEKKDSQKKTLFLDLDETLIHACEGREKIAHFINTLDENGEKIKFGINVRPYCKEFLEEMSLFYEIYIFTASAINYAEKIIAFLDPEKKYIQGILGRDHCLQTKNGFFIKDLRIIKDRDLKDIIIVDNLTHSFGFQIENGIPILEWKFQKKDQELLYLKDYLKEAFLQLDVREFNKKKLKLRELSLKKENEL